MGDNKVHSRLLFEVAVELDSPAPRIMGWWSLIFFRHVDEAHELLLDVAFLLLGIFPNQPLRVSDEQVVPVLHRVGDSDSKI